MPKDQRAAGVCGHSKDQALPGRAYMLWLGSSGGLWDPWQWELSLTLLSLETLPLLLGCLTQPLTCGFVPSLIAQPWQLSREPQGTK